ncbi:MAG: MurR/RpiR family transcriptional regulator [Ruminococcaceae bacterium]|nr:MurR/RpiR family transcriptional regulator [Oscillospiraceae bacterium]
MLLAKIQSGKNFMSKIERKIAETILIDPEKFIKYSAVELSSVAGVSQGSINNFSKKFANGGYSELKVKIATEIKAYKESYTNPEIIDNSISEIMKISAKNISDAFLQTQQINSEETLINVCNLIMNAKRIEVYGIAKSGVVAEDFAFQLLKLGYSVKCITEALVCPVSAMSLDMDSLMIAISVTGRTSDVYDSVRIAKNNGAKCICITRDEHSPVAKLCDEVIVVSGGNEVLSNYVDTERLCGYFLVDTICSYILSNMTDDEKLRCAKISNIITSHIMEG